MPAAPLVGAVTTRPPAAFSSLTASAYRLTQSSTCSGSRSARLRIAAELSVQVGGAAPHLEAAGQRAAGLAAAFDAGLHHGPDLQQSGVDLGVVAPMAFVAAHQLGDRTLLALRQREQFGAAAEGEGQHGRVGGDDLLLRAVGRDLVADDEAAADRVVGAAREHRARAVERRRSACRWRGTAATRAAWKTRSVFSLKAIGVHAEQRELASPRMRLQQRRDGSTSTVSGSCPAQPEQHGLVAAVALAGGARASRTGATRRARWRRAARRAAAAARTAAPRASGRRCASCDGPMPILKRSKTETAIVRLSSRRRTSAGRCTTGCGRPRRCRPGRPAPSTSPAERGQRIGRLLARVGVRPVGLQQRGGGVRRVLQRVVVARPGAVLRLDLRDLGADGDHRVAEAVELLERIRSRSARPSACRAPGSSASARGSRSRSAAWRRPRR